MHPVPSQQSLSSCAARCSGDFDFGLGSFSLLEEIGMGQKWAKFLNPNLSAASINQTPSNEFRIPASLNHDSQPSSKPLIFSSTGGAPQLSNVNMTQVSSNDFLPVGMDVCEGKQPRVADQSEPVACSPGGTQTQLVDRRPHQRPPPSFAQVRLHSNQNISDSLIHCCQFTGNQSPGLGSISTTMFLAACSLH